jgi:hypothetical protein
MFDRELTQDSGEAVMRMKFDSHSASNASNSSNQITFSFGRMIIKANLIAGRILAAGNENEITARG